jgi:hypothetical protein
MADKPPSKADGLRAMREANYAARNTPEAYGTSRKDPIGKAVSTLVLMTEPSRNSVSASPLPVVKVTKGKAASRAGRPRKPDGEIVSRATLYRRRKNDNG